MNDHAEDTVVDDPHPDDPTRDPAAPGGASSPGRGVTWWLGWAFAALGLIATAVLATLLLTGGDDADRAAAEEAAGRFALALTTWDASDGGMATTREQLREASTDAFDSEVKQLFGGTDDLAELEEIGARSTSEVEQLLVERVEGDQADVLAVVVQRVSTDITEGEEVSLRYARMGLLREDGAWQVDRVELLVDLLQDAAERLPGTNVPGQLGLDDGADGATDGADGADDAEDAG